MEYDLEMGKAAEEIKNSKAKIVCVQLPDGLKPAAAEVKRELEKMTGSVIVTWLGSCFGACDVPLQAGNIGAGLIIQFGHSAWKNN